MLNDSKAKEAGCERISALLDGELDRIEVTQACAQWRENAETRGRWHAYLLIGDVLRSDDLASHPTRDAGFLDALRLRLAAEPVVLAPERPSATASSAAPAAAEPRREAEGSGRRRRAWIAPAALAAGVAVVAGVLTLGRPGSLPDTATPEKMARAVAAPTLVAAPSVTAAALLSPASGATGEPPSFTANGQMIRDARLDRYLAAHQQFAGSSALGVPAGYLRNASAELAGR